MKILIVNPPFYRLQGASLIHYPPGCCYVAATLEKAGFCPRIYNADYDPDRKTILGNTNHINVKALTDLHAEYERRLNSDEDPIWQEIYTYIANYSPEVLIISVFSTTLTAGNKIASMAKGLNPQVMTVFEGCFNRGLHCAVDPSNNADWKHMDFALRKEPEYTAVDLIQAIKSKSDDFSHIKGLSWKKPDGQIVHNGDRPFMEDLDQLPYPARHCLDDYENIPPHCFQGIYGSRGCPFDCVFCGCHTSMGYKARIRSAENMVGEIEQVYERYGTRYFYICDDIFFIKKKRAHEFCHLLVEKKLPVYWSAQTRAEMVDDETLSLMKKAGGQHIAVGVEVGNPQVRKLIKKGNTVDDVRNCARLIRKNGLYMVAFCMIGLPWEGRSEIEDTVKLIKEIQPHIVYPYMPTPAAGTELAKIMMEKNPDGFDEYRDRCHLSTSAALAESMAPDEKQGVIEWALAEFVKLNRKQLLRSVWKRAPFYWIMAHDMNFFRRPDYLFGYLKDFLSNN
jgi:radical SAM superfamily enzyme YgiQ (UPF0313 family)